MKRLILVCVACLSLTAAVAWGSPLIGRPADHQSGAISSVARSQSVRHSAKDKASSRQLEQTHKRRRGVTHTHRKPATLSVMFGDTAVERTMVKNVRGRPQAFPFNNGSTGSAFVISVYVAPQNRAKTLIAGLYVDKNGRPGKRLASGTLSSPKAGAWNSIPISSTAIHPGKYWVAIMGKGGTLYFRARHAGACQNQGNRRGQMAALPSAWSVGATSNACPISANVVGTVTQAGTFKGILQPVSGGTGNQVSPAVGAPAAAAPADTPIAVPPVNTAAPTVSGTAVDGSILTATNGSWLDSPTSYAYQWQDCTTLGLLCTNIAGATSSTYTLALSDVGQTVRVVVTAGNAGGSTSAPSAQTATVALPPAPVNTAGPVVSGSTVSGQTLATTNGVWSNNPQSYSYAWQDCNSSGNSCSAISGATASSYTVAAGDVGHTIRSVVTASNAGGSNAASSAQTAVVTVAPPTNTVLPKITGSAIQGQALTTTRGTWSGSPTSYAYTWEDCNSSGNSCSSISGATASSYTLTAGDVGHTIRTIVTATNGGGSTPATSAASSLVSSSTPPGNTALPTLSGQTVQGTALSTSNGSWTNSPTSFAYQWQDCDSSGNNCSAITGATASSYTLAAGDVGDTIRAVVTATNAAGSTPATSAASSVVTSPPAPGNTVAPSVSGQMVQGDTLAASNGSWSNSPTSYGYQWEDCDSSGANCSNIANATSSGYTLAAGDVGDMVRVMVTASNSGGSGQAASAAVGPVTGSGGSGGLPSGVSLHQIDGGPSYYCSNGFSNACSAGWDNSSFFPILDDYAFYPGNSTTTFKALGLTSTVRVTGDENMSTLRSAGVTAIAAGDSASNFGSETVGGHVEEPSTWSDITSQANSLNSLFGLSGRFLQGSFTWNQLYYENLNGSVCGGSGTMTMQQVFSCTSGMPGGKHLNIATDDLYYFAGSGNSDIQYTGGNVENNGGTATAAQMARGSNYGDMVDIMRGWLQSPAQDAPIAPYIETEDGLLTGPGVREITPPELNWAVWSTILHGARMVIYFGTTSNYGSESTFGFSQSTLPGQSVSMYTQGQDTNKLVENLAPIINSPFALNYGSVTPAGYTFPSENLGWNSTSGIDVMTKYYTGGSFTNSSGTFGNGFYIIASPRAAETATNIAATFTIPGSYSGPVNVIDSSTGAPTTSTLNVSNHKITDTFAHAYDTQIIGPIPNQ